MWVGLDILRDDPASAAACVLGSASVWRGSSVDLSRPAFHESSACQPADVTCRAIRSRSADLEAAHAGGAHHARSTPCGAANHPGAAACCRARWNPARHQAAACRQARLPSGALCRSFTDLHRTHGTHRLTRWACPPVVTAYLPSGAARRSGARRHGARHDRTADSADSAAPARAHASLAGRALGCGLADLRGSHRACGLASCRAAGAAPGRFAADLPCRAARRACARGNAARCTAAATGARASLTRGALATGAAKLGGARRARPIHANVVALASAKTAACARTRGPSVADRFAATHFAAAALKGA